MNVITRHKKATTVTAVMARIKSHCIGIEMMKTSIPVSPLYAQVIALEANRVIATLNLPTPADRDSVESVLESLKAVAEELAPQVAKALHVRLIAIRNNIQVNQVGVPS